MNNLTLTCKDSGDFKPHPEGIHPSVCVDVMDLGLCETDFQGVKKMVNKVKLTFESEAKGDDGKPCTVSKNFTASLHPKAKLSEFLGKWRGRQVAPGETIGLDKLIGASCTLVISHQQNLSGKTYAAIDAVSKPTKKVAPSGQYDPAAARQRYADWKAKQASPMPGNSPAPTAAAPVAAPQASAPAPVKSDAGATRTGQPTAPDFDPEVGF
ncbi:MAG: hypothetical protein WCS42_16795 [Verrucomicrobiota bacterium]